jgi:hypothetical protein
MKMKTSLLALTLTVFGSCAAWAGSVCPGAPTGTTFPHPPDPTATGCNVLITINSDRSTSVVIKDATPYDGSDDFIVGIVNNSSSSVPSFALTGTGIFGLESDGMCIYSFPGSGYCSTNANGGSSISGVDPFDYYGPTSTFTNFSSGNSGTVTFSPPIAAGGSTYFSLEGAPSVSLGVTVAPGGGGTTPIPTPTLSVWAGLLLGGLLMAYSITVIRKNREHQS